MQICFALNQSRKWIEFMKEKRVEKSHSTVLVLSRGEITDPKSEKEN